MRNPIEHDTAEAEASPAEAAKRLAWEEPTLHRLSLSRTELGGPPNPDGGETQS